MDRGYGRIERVEITDQTPFRAMYTVFDLRGGVRIEQEVDPSQFDALDRENRKQAFVFDTNRAELATLTWLFPDGQEQRVLTITPTEEAINKNGVIRRDLKTGRRSLDVPGGVVYLVTADEFISGGIKKALQMEPIAFRFARKEY